MENSNPMIVALDVESADEALALVKKVGPSSDFYKVGMELYAAAGMEIVNVLGSLGKKVFLDLKLYDIGETVKRATRQICKNEAIAFLTVHGSRSLMDAAVEGRENSATRLLAVTVLTSFDAEDLLDLGYPASVSVSDLVDLRVKTAVESGMDGVVCSPLEAARVRQLGGPQLAIVTPGIRSAGASSGDQKRVATPAEAMRSGANFLVIGRQVTRAADPRAAFEKIREEIRSAA